MGKYVKLGDIIQHKATRELYMICDFTSCGTAVVLDRPYDGLSDCVTKEESYQFRPYEDHQPLKVGDKVTWFKRPDGWQVYIYEGIVTESDDGWISVDGRDIEPRWKFEKIN